MKNLIIQDFWIEVSEKTLIRSSFNNYIQTMLIIDVKNGESIDQALKRYKRKFQQTQLIKELRSRKEFNKPSVIKRNEKLKAVYKTQKQRAAEV